MVTITKELLVNFGLPSSIPDELLPMGLDQLFEAPIPTEDKLRILLHEKILGRRGMVYVAARAARRACTATGLDIPDSLRALDLCDRYASGEEISEEELKAAVSAESASNAFREAWEASDASGTRETLREAQLEDCREWILRASPKEKAAVLTRYQRVLRPIC